MLNDFERTVAIKESGSSRFLYPARKKVFWDHVFFYHSFTHAPTCVLRMFLFNYQRRRLRSKKTPLKNPARFVFNFQKEDGFLISAITMPSSYKEIAQFTSLDELGWSSG